ncbi:MULTISPECIES: SRPBCC family protein [unclassified Streptomyces]|uniref:SRPBCC family protein n=1 Tax=unclassified Streptomyces TaxID=2593676 RepID=UPI00324D92B8
MSTTLPTSDRPTSEHPSLCQVAFSVIDLARTERWFREGLGFWPAGGARALMRGPLASAVQGLPRVASTCRWLVGRNEWFQLEMFQFERPLARLMPPDRTPSDIGYARIGVWVADFDETLIRLARLASRPLTAPVGPPGARRACVRNPDGVFVEIMEDDPLGGAAGSTGRATCSVALRSVTLSVPDLARSAAFFDGLGLARSAAALRAPEHESLWALPGAQTRSAVYLAGDVLVEVVQYLDPVGRDRPADHRISDQGILNMAFGARSRRDHDDLYQRACRAGAVPNTKPRHLPGAGVVYVNDPQQFSVELLWMSAKSDKHWGFTAKPADRRPKADTHAIEQTVRIAAPVQATWDVITDHDNMASWLGIGSARRIVNGTPGRDGRGSQRLLKLPGTTATEQVVTFEPPTTYRYRVINGSPFVCHQGEISLRADGDETELTWTIRFRPKVVGSGGLLRIALSVALGRVLRSGLKPHVEIGHATHAGHTTSPEDGPSAPTR